MNRIIIKKILLIFLSIYIGIVFFLTGFRIIVKKEPFCHSTAEKIYLNVKVETTLFKQGDLLVFNKTSKTDQLSEDDYILFVENNQSYSEEPKLDKISSVASIFVNNYETFIYSIDMPNHETMNVYSFQVLGVYNKKIKGMGNVYDLILNQNFYLYFVLIPCFILLGCQTYKMINVIVIENKHAKENKNEK